MAPQILHDLGILKTTFWGAYITQRNFTNFLTFLFGAAIVLATTASPTQTMP